MSVPVNTVRTDGFTMDYFSFGHGDKTMVILPGLSVQSVCASADSVAAAYQLLADDFTIYLFERRNELPEAYTVYDMAEDTVAALEALGLKDVYLFGTSQGGMIAMTIAIGHPGLVTKLILGSTAACVTDESRATVGRWIELAQAGDAAGLYQDFAEAVYPPEMFEASRAVFAAMAQTVTGEELGRFAALAGAAEDFDVTADLDRITCPVLVIGSNDDRVLGGDASPRIAEAFAGRPDCRLYMYDGYGHAAYDTAPDYRERILDFFISEETD